ncbi:RDD family protein [Actomonas aquatica]|uniref:RDD family protein n=1 Tax=Actomonas aquatica TaxID=2866162 RepID=A0ABZ1C3P1_9BACT|nr:RDD family protein [Opitutus sp. WL0086]WRQ85972.1 RDD family protein [Opitutus sp. WL0086]
MTEPYRPITIPERISAGFLNLVLGGLPISVPKTLSEEFTEASLLISNEAFLDSLAVALVCIQYLLYFRYRGSPAWILFRIKIATEAGGRPSTYRLFLRSLPYLAYFLLITFYPPESESAGSTERLGLSHPYFDGVIFVLMSLLFLNSLTVLAFRGRSFIDILTKTHVVRRT